MIPDANNLALRRLSLTASLSVAFILIIGKMIAFLQTDSLAVLSSLIDSSIDMTASTMIFFAVRKAQKPADEDHRYGHGKAEAVAALTQAAFLAGSSLFLIIESINRFLHPTPPDHELVGVIIMIIGIILTGGLVLFQGHVIKKTKSLAIKADSMNYIGDMVMNVSVILALGLSHFFGWHQADSVFGFLIALYLARNAYKVANESLHFLMDRELAENDRQKILDLINTHSDVRGVHDLRTRSSGTHSFIEFHLELDGLMSLNAAHNVTDIVEHNLRAAYPNAEILIHQEPAGLHDDRLDHRLQSV